MDKVYKPLNLFVASLSVLGNQGAAGVDHQTVEQFQDRRLEELKRLEEELADRKVSAPRGQACVDSQAGQHGEAAVGYSDACAIGWCKQRCCNVLEPIFDSHVCRAQLWFSHTAGAVIMPWNGSRPC